MEELELFLKKVCLDKLLPAKLKLIPYQVGPGERARVEKLKRRRQRSKMATLRKASAYSKKIVRPFTRKANTRRKAYIKTVPPSKIVKFHMGNQKDYDNGKHKFKISYVASEKVQIRDNSLEACRLILVKILEKRIPGSYYFRINVYPHHILREHKMAAGAGADRLSSGMTHSFGVNVGRAAIVNSGKEVFFISAVDERTAREARKAMGAVKPKVPCRGKVVFEKIN